MCLNFQLFLVSEMARREVTVALTGDAGDELFGGYYRYRFAKNVWAKLSLFPLGLRRYIVKLLEKSSPEEHRRNLSNPQ